ncbi:hypothetical protein CJ030_MR1G014978 [Morella rubra]|uniref:S-protein homolog n=1 Tax=Morella rubra TaxID=262757 RepID=A0A6A1WWF3_9ROSI|nr:hypothetical protein CJ030_MR1G014978 [Morella rubra]
MNALQKSVLLLLLLHLVLGIEARVYDIVMNKLEKGRTMTLHCKSNDNDLGYQIVEDGEEAQWSFSVNLWHTTLFYCNVRWDINSPWDHFDAFSYKRDHDRCQFECLWQRRHSGTLYGFNQATRKQEKFGYKKVSDFETQ